MLSHSTLVFIAENSFEMKNNMSQAMRCIVSAFAPPYVKGGEGSNTVKRVAYPVFQVLPSCAQLLPRASMKVISPLK